MRLKPSKVVYVILATVASAWALLLAFGLSAAAAATSPIILRAQPPTAARPWSTAVLIAAAVMLAIAFASIVLFVLDSRRERGAASGQTVSLPTEHETEQTRRAA